MRIHFSADDVKLDVAKNASGNLAPTLASARNGSLLVELTQSELQGMLLAFARAGAAEQGATVESAELTLAQLSDRVLSANVKVKAKKSIMSVTMTVSGQAAIDDQLSVTLSRLSAEGQGMLGTLLAGAVGGKLKEHEGKVVSLLPEGLKGLTLQELRVSAKDPVQISATFVR